MYYIFVQYLLHYTWNPNVRKDMFSIFHIVFPTSYRTLRIYKMLSKEIPPASIELSAHMYIYIVVGFVMIEFDIMYRTFEGLN